MLKDDRLLAPTKIGTDGANTFPSTIKTSVPGKEEHAEDRWLPILQHGAENDRWFKGDAVAEERLWFFRRLDRQ